QERLQARTRIGAIHCRAAPAAAPGTEGQIPRCARDDTHPMGWRVRAGDVPPPRSPVSWRWASYLPTLVSLQSRAFPAERPIPRFESSDGKHALLVEGAPFLVLGGQAHNSIARRGGRVLPGGTSWAGPTVAPA